MPDIRHYEITKTIRLRITGCLTPSEALRRAEEETDMTRWQERSSRVDEDGNGLPETIHVL